MSDHVPPRAERMQRASRKPSQRLWRQFRWSCCGREFHPFSDRNLCDG